MGSRFDAKISPFGLGLWPKLMVFMPQGMAFCRLGAPRYRDIIGAIGDGA